MAVSFLSRSSPGASHFARGSPRHGKLVACGSRLADPGGMDLDDAVVAWRSDGFVILPGFLPAEELTCAVQDLDLLFPSADGFHDGTDPRHKRFIGDEFA